MYGLDRSVWDLSGTSGVVMEAGDQAPPVVRGILVAAEGKDEEERGRHSVPIPIQFVPRGNGGES